MLSVRPKVAELAFQLYGRSLHPELFQTHQTRELERAGYRARLEITSAGHVVTWRYDGITLTEVASSATHPLPQKRRLMCSPLRGDRTDLLECRGGIIYRCSFQLETVAPEVFWTFQKQMSENHEPEGLLHRFDSSGRMALGALSYMHAVTRARQLTIQAFHTFPDDHAIVRTRSEFILPKLP